MTSVSGQAAEVSVMSMTAMFGVVDGDAVDEAEVDDVDAELGVDDVAACASSTSSTVAMLVLPRSVAGLGHVVDLG